MIIDHKGNEIKPGMEICLVKVIDRHTMIFGVTIPKEGGGYDTVMEEKRPDRPCWEPGPYYEVGDDLRITKTQGNYSFRITVSMWMEYIDKECFVLAIKGISDQPTTNTATK